MSDEGGKSVGCGAAAQGEPWSLLSGEVHYWRLERGCWPAVLDAAHSLGVECIGTYVPWQHHERADGSFEFSELEAFLDLVEARGLRVFARPGPYIYAEWRNLGVPDDVVPFAKHTPEFRARAARWIAAVMRVLAPRLGHLVVALQADNEIDPMPHFYGEDQGFAAWLTQHYASVAELNATWGTSYASFAEPAPTLVPFDEDARYRDGQRYRYDLASDYARWVVAQFRQHSGATPLVLNTWPYVNAQHWREFAELADVFGIDPYPENECTQGFRELREQLRLLRCVTPRPFVAELGAGIWRGARCDFTPEHYRLTALTALAGGARGWNWYMLAERDNWSGAPIDARGGIDPRLGPAFRAAASAFHQLRAAPPPSVSCGVTWSWAYHQTAATRKQRADDELLAVLHEMGLEYDFVDVDRGARVNPVAAVTDSALDTSRAGGWGVGGCSPGAPRLLFVAGDLADAAAVWRHAEQGGIVVCFQRLIAGCARPDGTSHHAPENLEVSLGFSTSRPVFVYRRVPGEPIWAVQRAWTDDSDQALHAALAVGRRYLVGYIAPHGRGQIVVVGCAPGREAVLALHRRFGVPIPALSLTPGVHVARRGAQLVVLNPGAACRARLATPEGELELELARCDARIVPLAR